VTLDDGDIGVPYVSFQLGANVVKFFAALSGVFRHWHACDPRGRPQKDLGGAMVANHLRLDAFGIDPEMFAKVDAKAKAVEIRSRTQYAIVPGRVASNVGERVWRIGDRDQHRVRSGANDMWDNVAINRRVLVEQPEMSVATASAVRRVRFTSTISRALPRATAASAMAHPTLPVPMMPSFMRRSPDDMLN
jgi:hypothetical protein